MPTPSLFALLPQIRNRGNENLTKGKTLRWVRNSDTERIAGKRELDGDKTRNFETPWFPFLYSYAAFLSPNQNTKPHPPNPTPKTLSLLAIDTNAHTYINIQFVHWKLWPPGPRPQLASCTTIDQCHSPAKTTLLAAFPILVLLWLEHHVSCTACYWNTVTDTLILAPFPLRQYMQHIHKNWVLYAVHPRL